MSIIDKIRRNAERQAAEVKRQNDATRAYLRLVATKPAHVCPMVARGERCYVCEAGRVQS